MRRRRGRCRRRRCSAWPRRSRSSSSRSTCCASAAPSRRTTSASRPDRRCQSGLFEDPGFLPAGRLEGGRARGRSALPPRSVALRPRQPEQYVGLHLPAQEGLRASLEPKLIDASRAETDPKRRSRLLNLLGVVAMSATPSTRATARTPSVQPSTRSRTRSRPTRTTRMRSSTSRSCFATSSTRSPRASPDRGRWAAATPAWAATAAGTDGPTFLTRWRDLRRVGAAATRYLLVSRAARRPDSEPAAARRAPRRAGSR